jgi:hypothetical protein
MKDDLMPNNSIKMSPNEPFINHQTKVVTRVRLRGSWTTGNHQEVMLTLSDGTLVRISRTNGSDTFQIGAQEEGASRNPMHTLIETNIPAGGPTCRAALQAFRMAHNAARSYEQADCHQFARSFYLALVPGTQGFPAEEEFM